MIAELLGVAVLGVIAGALIWTHGYRAGENQARERARWMATRSER